MKLQEYSTSVILSRNEFLVDIVKDEKLGRILKLDSIKEGDAWKGFDMLIFNTWHWWLHRGRHQPYVTATIYVIITHKHPFKTTIVPLWVAKLNSISSSTTSLLMVLHFFLLKLGLYSRRRKDIQRHGPFSCF